MTVSIIICTRNRVESLKLTLESIGKTTVPPEWKIELLVIDNGSTDSTEAMVTSTVLPNLPIRYVREQRPGKGYAYNAGLGAARGQIFLFTDDDVRVPINWISGMCRPILDGAADAVGGGVCFPPEIAATLARPPFASHQSWYASTEELDWKSPTRMVGANMAFHRRVLDRVPKFDIELGPGALGFHDETLFSWQLLAAGYHLVSAFDVMVEHYLDLSRLTNVGAIDVARKMGRSHAFVFHHWEHKRSRLAFPHLIVSHLRRRWMQCTGQYQGNDTVGVVSGAVLRLEHDLAFYREYLAQRRRQYKYPPRSLASRAATVRSCLSSNGV
jgi:glycosyltransferase involved in cell wall biosynthesis